MVGIAVDDKVYTINSSRHTVEQIKVIRETEPKLNYSVIKK